MFPNAVTRVTFAQFVTCLIDDMQMAQTYSINTILRHPLYRGRGVFHDVALIHTEVWKSAYRGILPESFLRDISLEKRVQLRQKIYCGDISNADSRINLVARVNGVTVGFCDGLAQ